MQLCLFCASLLYIITLISNEYKKYKKLTIKMDYYFGLMDTWMTNREAGIHISELLKKNGYNSASIYGMGRLGQRLYNELKADNYKVIFVTDQRRIEHNDFIDLDSVMPETDVMIVTAVCDFVNIKRTMSKKIDCPIISLDYILREEKECGY